MTCRVILWFACRRLDASKKPAHSVLHRFLHEVEPLPAGVELVLVGAFEVQQVTDDLYKDAGAREVTAQQHGNHFIFIGLCLFSSLRTLTGRSSILPYLDYGEQGLGVVLRVLQNVV